MDPETNPYAPGAGTIPPELAGRNELIETVQIQLARCQKGLAFKSMLMVGLRGVGKTILLNHLTLQAENKGLAVVAFETPEKRSLPALLIPALRSALLKLSRRAAAKQLGEKTLRILGSFVRSMKMRYQDIEFALDLGCEEGIADSGDLENDLMELFVALGKVAKQHKTALILFIDELQYIKETEFAALIMALHKCTQLQLPVTLIGAGLPQLVGQAGRAKSYAERLFDYPQIGALGEAAAEIALVKPAEKLGVTYQKSALKEIFAQTQGYPYFLQEWGKHGWNSAKGTSITLKDITFATGLAIAELDMSFFRVRFDRLTPAEKKYLRAMAELGDNTHRSGDIAQILGKEVQAVAPTRASLIRKGMIYSPEHGDNSFTVPLFGGYMKRVMPLEK